MKAIGDGERPVLTASTKIPGTVTRRRPTVPMEKRGKPRQEGRRGRARKRRCRAAPRWWGSAKGTDRRPCVRRATRNVHRAIVRNASVSLFARAHTRRGDHDDIATTTTVYTINAGRKLAARDSRFAFTLTFSPLPRGRASCDRSSPSRDRDRGRRGGDRARLDRREIMIRAIRVATR